MNAIYYALFANLSFSAAIIFYTVYSQNVSVVWTNAFKAVIAFFSFLIAVAVYSGWHHLEWSSFGAFFASGLFGLAVGDIFLLRAFTIIGPSRTMVLFGFQPLFMGFASWAFFDQSIPLKTVIAVFLLIACLFVFSYEKYRVDKTWEIKGIAFALLGVILDSVGILLTRYGFDQSLEIHVFEGNFYRCIGALAGFYLLHKLMKPIPLVKMFKTLTRKSQFWIIFASLLGTFLSLAFYLEAIRIGHLASVTAISITGPFFSALFENIYRKTWPSKLFLLSFVFFSLGFYFLNM